MKTSRKQWKKIIASTLGLAFLMLFTQFLYADQTKTESARIVAEKWLALVDAQKYGESWQNGAAYFKKAVSEKQWSQSMTSFRKPLGKVLSRSLASKTYTNRLPGAPDGEYVVLQFKTSFEKKSASIETVTPMLDTDGVWRVSGYYFK
jgi:hypothetical protein